jgi:sterol 3beta-glucosyltransferase
MRVLVAAVGSTGDVLPYLGLGQCLTAHGFHVTVATHRSFEPQVIAAGLTYAYLPMEPAACVTEELTERLRRGPRSAASVIHEMFGPWAADIATALDAACDAADHVLLSAMAWTGVHSADARELPSTGVHLQPLEPTGAFAPAMLGVRTLGATMNRALGHRAQALMVEPYMSTVNAVRSEHGLPGLSGREHLRMLRERNWPVLYGFSPTVVPRPADWRDGLRVVGYWWPPTSPGWRPDPGLVEFLDDGPAPVFVGFGSTFPGRADDVAALLRRVARQLRVRMVVQAGWLGLRVDDDTIRTVGPVPHDWLLPRVSVAVHHAGAGTSAAALRAGVPSVAVPVALDQPFWAQRLHRIGAATRPVPASRLTAQRLAQAVEEALHSDPMKRRAAEIGARIREERGHAAVAEMLTARRRDARKGGR